MVRRFSRENREQREDVLFFPKISLNQCNQWLKIDETFAVFSLT